MKEQSQNLKQNKKQKRKKPKLLIGLVVVALLLAGWYVLNSRKVGVTKVLKGSTIDSVYATGVIDTPYMVQLSFKMGGRILKINAKEGDTVKKDQILAELDGEDVKSRVEEQAARVAYLKADYDRANSLFKKRVGSLQEAQKAEAEYQAGMAYLAVLKKNQDDLFLRSPDTCQVILDDELRTGSYVTTNDTVFWLDCSGILRITAEVDEENMVHVKVGQKVYFKYDGLKGQTFEGKIAQITPKGDSSTRYFRIRIDIPQDTPLMIGMTVEVNILLDKKDDSLLVPTSALSFGQDMVWVVDGNKLKKVPVKAGVKGDRQTEILSGLKQGDEIIQNPQSWFKEGMWVRPVAAAVTKAKGKR